MCSLFLWARRKLYGYNTEATVYRKRETDDKDHFMQYRYQYDRTTFILSKLLTHLLSECQMQIPNEVRHLIIEIAGGGSTAESPMYWHTITVQQAVSQRVFDTFRVGEVIQINADPKYPLSCAAMFGHSDNSCAINKCNYNHGHHIQLWCRRFTMLSIVLMPGMVIYFTLIYPFIIAGNDGPVPDIWLVTIVNFILLIWIGVGCCFCVETQQGNVQCRRCTQNCQDGIGYKSELMSFTDGGHQTLL